MVYDHWMPRTLSKSKKDQVPLRLPVAILAVLDKLAAIGEHGTNRTEVARYLIIRGIEEVRRSGYLRDD